jgi:hypothetical protein
MNGETASFSCPWRRNERDRIIAVNVLVQPFCVYLFAAGVFNSGVPFLVDVSPGYDNHLVFPRTRLQYGFTAAWREALTRLAADYGSNGVVYNSWNGYTEGVAAVPTTEHKDRYYRWLQTLNAGGDREAGKRRRGEARLRP